MMECLKVLVLLFVCVNSESIPFESKSKDWSIRMIRNFKYPVVEDFQVFWNVPTNMCRQYKIFFEETLKLFKITVNPRDEFRGDNIVILYDPGLFPAMIKQANGSVTKRNEGISQKGDITKHLKAFEEDLTNKVPKNFNGLGVIDFEVWRPIFRQNWNDQTVYKDLSVELVKRSGTVLTTMTDQEVNKTAAQEFEDASRNFMEQTLQKAKELRPRAEWGYYGYPYCYGFRGDWKPHCPPGVDEENNRIKWLFEASGALYPSIYVSSNLTTKEQEGFYVGKLNEAWRMVSSVYDRNRVFIRVYPYFWFNYNNNDNFLSETDTKQAFEITKKYKMGGMVIWGASDNVKTKEKCEKLLNHVKTILGPAVLKVAEKKDQKNDKSLEPSDKSNPGKI